MSDNKLRIDKYLWAIRIFKTRSQATKACDEGRVKHHGVNIKPSKPVAVGDKYDIRAIGRKWTVEVTELLYKRMKYEEAIKYYVDLTSDEDKEYNKRQSSIFYTGKRLSKTGRPTKKQRRDLNEFFDPDIEDEI